MNIHVEDFTGFKALFVLFLLVISLSVFAQKDLEKADEYYNKQLYKDALEFYLRHESTLPDSLQKHPILVKIGSCYSEMQNSVKAAYYYSSAIAIRDNLSSEQKLNYVNALIETAQYETAKSYLSTLYDIIYFEDVLINSCDYALTHTEVNENISISPINNQYSAEVFGMAFFNSKLLYTVPYTLSNRKRTINYLYDYISEYSLEYEFQNKAIKNSTIYTPSFDSLNNRLYFSRNLSEYNVYYESNREDLKIGIGGTNNLGIYTVNLDDNKGKNKPELLPFINYDYNSTHPHISDDGQTLYFSSDLPGGYGGYDIYYAKKTKDGWGRPVNMGARVNTIMNEGYPYYYEGQLYFSSNGHPGYGGLDIFHYNTTTNEVENPGKPLNSSSDDFYFLILNSGSGFFISNRNRKDGKDIIYLFEGNIPK